MLFHVIGDSHIQAFKGTFPFIVYHLGAATAYGLLNERSRTNAGSRVFVISGRIDKKNDCVILSFGEVDCRIHVYNVFMKNDKKTSMSDIIDNIIERYGQFLKEYQKQNINFFVWGIPPACFQDNVYNVQYYRPDGSLGETGPQYYATEDIRAAINKEFNEKLSVYCKTNNIKYINIHPLVHDEHGMISKEYSDDGIHLNAKVLPLVMDIMNTEFGFHMVKI